MQPFEKQEKFITSSADATGLFAGRQFGKTTALLLKLREFVRGPSTYFGADRKCFFVTPRARMSVDARNKFGELLSQSKNIPNIVTDKKYTMKFSNGAIVQFISSSSGTKRGGNYNLDLLLIDDLSYNNMAAVSKFVANSDKTYITETADPQRLANFSDTIIPASSFDNPNVSVSAAQDHAPIKTNNYLMLNGHAINTVTDKDNLKKTECMICGKEVANEKPESYTHEESWTLTMYQVGKLAQEQCELGA